MFSTAFALCLAAHLISDFVLQTDKIAQNKNRLKEKEGRRALLKHAAATFAMNLIALYLLLGGWQPLFGAVAITAAHIVIDILRNLFPRNKRRTLKFLADQLLHAVVIAAAVSVITAEVTPSSGYYALICPWLHLPAWGAVADNVVRTLAVGVACVCGGSCLIRFMLDDMDLRFEPDGDSHAGKWIGMLERTAMLALIPLGQWAAAGLLLTAKSIARHKLLDEKKYAEYYLVGTLLSFLIALSGGLLISKIWSA